MTKTSAQSTASILTHHLACGAMLVLEPNASVQSAGISWLIPAGTANDPLGDGKDGLAVMCAELLERGAGGLDSRAFNDRLDRLGAIREVGVHRLVTRISASIRGVHVAETLDLLTDLVLHPELPENALEAVRSLCLQAIDGLGDDPGSRASVALHRRALPAPFNRSTYGSASVIRELDIDSIRSAWKSRCHPTGSIIAVSGNIQPDAIIAQMEERLQGWTGMTLESPKPESIIGGNEHLEQPSSQVHLEMGLDGPCVGEPDELAFLAAVRALGSGASSRLFEHVRERHGLCYDVHAGYGPNTHFGLCSVGAGTTPERVDQTLECIMEELRRFADHGIEVDEFVRVRRGMKTRLLMQGESTSARAFALALDQHQRGEPRSLDMLSSEIDDLTHEKVENVIRARMGGDWLSNPVLVAVGPRAPFS